jgi:hypothetical protein
MPPAVQNAFVRGFKRLFHPLSAFAITAGVFCKNLLFGKGLDAAAVNELPHGVKLMIQVGCRRGFFWQAHDLRAVFWSEMKATGQFVDEPALDHVVPIASTGGFYAAQVLAHGLQRLLFDACMSQAEQSQHLLHPHTQLMCGCLFIGRNPLHIILRTLTELLQQTL